MMFIRISVLKWGKTLTSLVSLIFNRLTLKPIRREIQNKFNKFAGAYKNILRVVFAFSSVRLKSCPYLLKE